MDNPPNKKPVTKDTEHNSGESPTHQSNLESKGNNNKRRRIRKNKELTITTINVRGIKGKIKSLESLLQAEKIDIALITETKMKKGDQISIKGYRWIEKQRTDNKGGGLGILVSETIANNTTENNSLDDHELLESKWIRIECRPRNIAVGVFYGPQENEKVEKVKEIYNALSHQIHQILDECDIVLAGDFNAKLKISKETCEQAESRNGKILQEMITENNLTPATINADHGIWTRANRKIKNEKSVIDYIMVSPRIMSGINTVIVDEEGHLGIKGKNETDHNTLLMTMKMNHTRKPKYIKKWNLGNKEGWKEFNKKVIESENARHIEQGPYAEAEKRIKTLLKQTIGEKQIRTDKVRRTNNNEIKKLRAEKKKAKKNFQEACKYQNNPKKVETKNTYMESQKKLREAIENEESRKIEAKLQELSKKAKINPNIIWETRKRAKGFNGLDYNTVDENGKRITNPQETKAHIADYFEDLYQAREGTEEYREWTHKIKEAVEQALKPCLKSAENDHEINSKEFNTVIKKLKRKKSLGPDKIPNKIFIEANRETKEVLKNMINSAHISEEIPEAWEEGEIMRLYKGKGVKGKCSNKRGITLASNVGKVYERIINERVKSKLYITKAQAGGKAGCSTADHLIVLKQVITEICKNGKTAYIIFLDVQKAYDKAWLDAIIYTLHKNGIEGKNLRMIKKLNSNLTAKIQTRYGLTRKINIKVSIRQGGVLSVIEYAALIDEISKELRKKGLGLKIYENINIDSLLWMDDVCLIHHDLETLQEMLDTTNHVALKYHIQFGAAKCKVIRKGKVKKSKLKLNGETLEEVTTYKYLGEIINNKGNLSDHISEVEKKYEEPPQR